MGDSLLTFATGSRRNTLGLFTVAMVQVLGCSSTVAVVRPVTPSAAQEVLRAVSGRRVELGFVPSGNSSTGAENRQGYLSDASARAFIYQAEKVVPVSDSREIPYDQLRTITYRDAGKGAFEGALLGALPGILGGIFLGSALEGLQCSSDARSSGTCESYVPKFALGFGAITGVIGAAIGYVRGHRTTFTF